MIEKKLAVTTPEGVMDGFIFQPDGPGPFAPVVLYMYVGGLTEKMKDLARRVAQAGYAAVLPNLYYRFGNISFDTENKNPVTAEIRKLVRPIIDDRAKMMSDVGSLLASFDADPAIKKGPVGCVGYCMGGGLAIWSADTYPDRFKATASMFGTRLYGDAPISPHLSVGGVTGEFYCGMAESDHSMSLEAVAKFEQVLRDKCPAKWQVEIHPGTLHGFAFAGSIYHHEASERAWERIFAMYERVLG